MPSLFWVAISSSLFAFLAVWLAFGLLSKVMLIWVAAISWACYVASGGGKRAVKSTVLAGIHGIFWAWLANVMVLVVPLPWASLTAPFWVGIAIFMIVYSGKISLFSNIPAGVLGFASVVAYLVQTPDAMTMQFLLDVSMSNLLFYLSTSLLIGASLGFLADLLAAKLDKGWKGRTSRVRIDK